MQIANVFRLWPFLYVLGDDSDLISSCMCKVQSRMYAQDHMVIGGWFRLVQDSGEECSYKPLFKDYRMTKCKDPVSPTYVFSSNLSQENLKRKMRHEMWSVSILT